jgi:hypothetical protein
MTKQPLAISAALFFLLFLGVMHPAQAQGGYASRHPFDFKKFNMGFLIGANYNMYNLKEQVQIMDDNVLLKRIRVNPKPGLRLGMITNFNLHPQIAFRIIPSISLEERDFDYVFETKLAQDPAPGDSVVIRQIDAAYFNVPFLFQFKSKYWKRTRFYVNAGPQLGLNLASNKKVRDDEDLLKISNFDLSLVFAFGFNLYGDRIKLSPELQYSMGLLNVYEPLYTTHAAAIGQLYTQVLTLNINFE